MRNVCVKVVPKVLSNDQKQCLKGVCVDMLEIANKPNLLESFVAFLPMTQEDNAPAHMALSVKQFLTSINITVMGHSPY
ncbi:hypothetical protein TNCV_1639831 [Trichonephila clavipes]|nr:hypothetical protein TNCV_1639831 [Trichonephila clavipes]